MYQLCEQVVRWVPVVLEYGAVVFPLLWYWYRFCLLIGR